MRTPVARVVGSIATLLVGTLVLSFSAEASGVVGIGTPASCTEAALTAALAGGGSVTFSCGSSPVTITLTSKKVISAPTSVDGGGLVTLSGGGTTQIFEAQVDFNLANLTLTRGLANLSLGGALLADGAGGMHVNVVNCTFSDNEARSSQGAEGGAIHLGGPATLDVANSTFTNNKTTTSGVNADGGAISVYEGTATITNSTFWHNSCASTGFIPLARGGAIFWRRRHHYRDQ